MSTTVLLVDDHELIRQGLARAFERDDEMTVVGQAGSVAEGLAAFGELQPDVVVTDLQLPDGHGLDVVRAVRATSDTVGLVVLTMHAGDDQIFAAMEAGCVGVRGQGQQGRRRSSAPPSTPPSRRARSCAPGLSAAMMRRATGRRPRRSPGARKRCSPCWPTASAPARSPAGSTSASRRPRPTSPTSTRSSGAANRAQALVTAMRMGLLDHLAPQRF